MKELIELMIDVLEVISKMERITYRDYFFTQARIKKRIGEIEKETGIKGREVPKVNTSWRYIKYGD